MSANTVDVLIYVQAKVNPDIVTNMVKRISEVAGVVKASINPKVKHLLAVEYDPCNITGRAILNIARQDGVNATLVGM
jgi:hypothetical protein